MISKTDVLIVGCGPTGAVLANLLGLCGVRTILLEKETEIFPVPRATHIDEETKRNFQLTGLMPLLEQHLSPFGYMEVLDENGNMLMEENIVHPG